jgi:hypothetical protein
MEPRNRFQGMNSASQSNLASRYDNPIPTRFLAGSPHRLFKNSSSGQHTFPSQKYTKKTSQSKRGKCIIHILRILLTKVNKGISKRQQNGLLYVYYLVPCGNKYKFISNLLLLLPCLGGLRLEKSSWSQHLRDLNVVCRMKLP